ncbi:DUF418 domain-containing protein [Streptomyces albus]|uniref:DUF418 domain-containing protein n=1 Tax=Streptomyces albus TaxID=1888 RepID=UPI003402B2F6
MTETESAKHAPPPPMPAPGSPSTERGAPTARLVGVDLARALAVFGMFTVHVGASRFSGGGAGTWLWELANGRASALFATLAGFSLMLIAGRREPKTGLAGRQAKARIVIRAVVLLALGTALAMTDFGDAVILNSYGVYFLLALPLVRLRARTLATIAVALAVIAPQVAFGLKALLHGPIANSLNAYDPLERLSGVGLLDILLTGMYPALTWMTFVVTGMALGRLELTSGAVQRQLAVLGPALIVLGYGVSWLALRLSGGQPPTEEAPGSVSDAWGLLAAEPHTSSTFDLVGSLGVAITVLLSATVAMDRLPWLRRLATPLIAVGTMSLTLYVGHILVILALPGEAVTPPESASAALLCAFVSGATLFAAVWSRFFRRGPLEYLLNSTTRLANSVR